ncbi:uncharacterized protein LOC108196521 [Daucus carota subsp. sativus]|uniref:Uncharacterized protein n=1 Tax=Daucus carota subsp. sativus TaxID=79200 RepID=A0A166HG67_DAUCS|nr:PREDICTED: uncharacterized protein LOC108196521 [Daucus carota subsp. sativus]
MQARVIAPSFLAKLKPSAQYNHFFTRLLCSSGGRTADPAVHSTDDPMGPTSAIHSPEEAYKDMENKGQRDPTPVKDKDPFVTSKAPISSSPQLKTSVSDQHAQPPTTQQKRNNSTLSAPSCEAFDPWSGESEEKRDRREMRREQEEDDKEYFSHHKASPLSEIEVADTRKPVTQATDGTAGGSEIGYDGAGGGVIMFREEQRVGAEETMRRATEMWRQTAARGDPYSPHGRVLRSLRGEDW